MESNNGNVELNAELVEIIKQYADLVKGANEETEIGPHISFKRYKKFKNVSKWYKSFTENPDKDQRENLIRIFTTGSRSESVDYKIREKYNIVDDTKERLINANQQGGSFINLIKKLNNIDTIDLTHISKYFDQVILEVAKIYKKEGNNYKFTDFGNGKYQNQNVFKELLFLLNINQDNTILENGCKDAAMKFILETQNFKKEIKKKDVEPIVIESIIKIIEQNTDNKIPKYLKLDQFFNVIHKTTNSDIGGIKDKESFKEFYKNMNKYFMDNSPSYKSQKDFMETLIKNKNTILHGPPGTGKTYQITQYLKDNAIEGEYKYIVFHPNYGYEDFIDGIKPTGFENGQIKLELVNGHFKQFCIDVHNKNINATAKNDLPKYYFVVDEINRANLSAVFGETLMLLEDSYRYKYFDENGNKIDAQTNQNNGRLITLKNSSLCTKGTDCFVKINDEVLFGIPENIYFIGMMNDVDRSIDSFDLALRRRFAWIERGYDKTVVMRELGLDVDNKYLKCIEELNKFLLDRLSSSSFQLGHSYFLNVKDSQGETAVKELFNNHLKPLIKEYLRTEYSGNEIESIDGKSGLLNDALKEFLKPFTYVKSTKVNEKNISNEQESN